MITFKPVLTLELAKKIADKASEEARRNGWNVVIAVVDDGANLLYLERLDGAPIASIEVAIRKASTAIRFKKSTKALNDRLATGGPADVGLVALPEILPFEGGVPLILKEAYIGAIGVSGVTSEEDGQIAATGLAALRQQAG